MYRLLYVTFLSFCFQLAINWLWDNLVLRLNYNKVFYTTWITIYYEIVVSRKKQSTVKCHPKIDFLHFNSLSVYQQQQYYIDIIDNSSLRLRCYLQHIPFINKLIYFWVISYCITNTFRVTRQNKLISSLKTNHKVDIPTI